MTTISQDVKDLCEAAKRRALDNLFKDAEHELVRVLKSIDQRLEAIEREVALVLCTGQMTTNVRVKESPRRPIGFPFMSNPERLFASPEQVDGVIFEGFDGRKFKWSRSHKQWVEVEHD